MKKIIQKADEMEMAINMKATKLAYGFITLALLVYCIADFVKTGEMPSPLFAILGTAGAIFWTVKLVETKRMAGDSDEE